MFLICRVSKGRRSNLRSVVKPLNFVAEEVAIPEASTSEASSASKPKRTRKKKQTELQVAVNESQMSCDDSGTEEVQEKEQMDEKLNNVDIKPQDACSPLQSLPPPKIPSPEVTVKISTEERLSAELAKEAEASSGRAATKIAIAETAKSSGRSSGRCSLKLRRSLAGLRHSMTQESVRRASRRSMLKRKASCKGNSSCSSSVTGKLSVCFICLNKCEYSFLIVCIFMYYYFFLCSWGVFHGYCKWGGWRSVSKATLFYKY